MVKQNLKKHIINFRGPKLNQKYIVFESDDWGAIRIPNAETRDFLFEKGLTKKSDPFSKFDSLETTEDYRELYKVLKNHTDKNGAHPLLTANFILNNPNFNKIKAQNFKQYYSEPFTETYNNSAGCQEAWSLLNEGIKKKLLVPQFHGSEHLNVVLWMNKLKAGNERFKMAFNKDCYAIDERGEGNRRQNLMAAYDYNTKEELEFIEKSIRNGLQQFEDIFGFASLTNIAPCYVWDKHIETALLQGNVKGIQGSFLQNYPIPGKSFKKKYRYLGQKNKDNQFYLVRNCLFEPSINKDVDWVSKCMESIEIAFKWGKPAVIGTHRINFAGRLDIARRNKNLELFNQLLTNILKRWPEIEFTDSASLLKKYSKA